MEDVSWIQKLRAPWLKKGGGDKCPKCFHLVANSHWRNNAIEVIQVDGNVLLEAFEIKGHMCLFYERLLMEQFTSRPKLDDLAYEFIDIPSVCWLERLFEEEVIQVVRKMAKDKALGPDSFIFFSCFL